MPGGAPEEPGVGKGTLLASPQSIRKTWTPWTQCEERVLFFQPTAPAWAASLLLHRQHHPPLWCLCLSWNRGEGKGRQGLKRDPALRGVRTETVGIAPPLPRMADVKARRKEPPAELV